MTGKADGSKAQHSSMVEHRIDPGDTASIPDTCDRQHGTAPLLNAEIAQLVERRFRKAEAIGSIPIFGST